MSVGKRTDAGDPLTEHDVAERLDRAAARLLRILMDVRQIPGLAEDVKASRYLSAGLLEGLAAELETWGIEPSPIPDERRPR